jgi:hypothetical protein
MSNSTAAAWRKEMAVGLQKMQAESGGVASLFVVRPCDAARLVACALAGNSEAAAVLQAVSRALDGIQRAPRRRPMLCASCPRPLRHGRYAVAVAIPDSGEASQALALAVCTRCATDPAEIGQKAFAGFRRFWPDARTIQISHPGGGTA